jgi:GNAT superfamily N-acetyltransferase
MRWYRLSLQPRTAQAQPRGDYPLAGAIVGGLRVSGDPPNQGSISASLDEYEVLPGIREVQLSQFTEMGDLSYYSASEKARTQSLADQIRASGWIAPLIVVVDEKGPYVLEGGHRFDALRELGAKSFPAMVVMDTRAKAEEDLDEIWARMLGLARKHDVRLQWGEFSGVPEIVELWNRYNEVAKKTGQRPLGWASPEGGWAMESWVGRNCKFAQSKPDDGKQIGQQLMLPFHDPSEYTTKPTDVVPDLMDYAPEGAEADDWVSGFWHVTTNLPAVLSSGELRSRSQLGGAVGLGGGGADAAPDKVSVTHDRQKADSLASAMRFAADVANGLAKPSLILSEFMDMHGAMDDISRYSTPNLYGTLLSHGVPRKMLGDEPAAGLEAWLDANVQGGQARYEFMQAVDEALLQDAEQLNAHGAEPGAYSGFTMPYEAFSAINPKNIGIVQVMVRRDAAPEHVPGEAELRFDPNDVMLLQDRRTTAGRRLAQQQYFDFYSPQDQGKSGEEHWPDPSIDPAKALSQMIADMPGEVEKFLSAHADVYEPREVSFGDAGSKPPAKSVVVVLDEIVVELDSYPEAKPAAEWLADINDMYLGYYVPYHDFNEEFWGSVGGPGSVMYHATDPDNVDDIMRNGLSPDSRTRGISNRSMGAAVFTSSDPSLVSSYGSAIIAIDVGRMKADGYMPRVSQEEPFEDERMRAALACKIGMTDYCPYSEYSSEGLDEQTVALFGNIPPKYLRTNVTAAWVGRNCKFAQAGVRYVPVGEDDFDGDRLDQATLDAAWRLAKESGINILRSKQLSMVAVSPDGKAIGALWTTEGGYGDKYSFDVAVSPEWRRMGIGSRLAQEGKAMHDPEAWPEGMELDAVSEGGEALSRGLGLSPVREAPGRRFYASATIMVRPGMLFGWRPKVEETIEDLRQGRTSRSTGAAVVSKLDSVRGGWFVMDGHHRAMEAIARGDAAIPCSRNQHVPFFERPEEANRSMTSNMVCLADAAKGLSKLAGRQPWEMPATGPEYSRMTIDELDKAAFGFARADVKTLRPGQLRVKWQDDYDNVVAEQRASGLDKESWARKIDLSQPIDVIFEDGQFKVNDGYHRWYAASILGKPLNVTLEIKDKPHRAIVERALREGKPVPPEVLRDYPDLRRAGWMRGNCKFAR